MPLTVERMSFDSSAKEAWVGGWKVHRPPATFAALRPSFLTEILAAKAQIRPNRFFGEAYVAGQWGYDDAWYSSYKWLTSARWTSATKARDPLNQRFKSALRTHFPKLSELQTRAIAAEAELGVRPVAPDLWLLRRGEHWFLEVKILPDDVADTQLVGLALIAEHLPAREPVRVGVVYLVQEPRDDKPDSADIRRRFQTYCAKLRRSDKPLQLTSGG